MKNTATKNNFLLLALIATLVAIGVHGYLTIHYYDLKFGTSGSEAICNINELLNCDAVTASKYAALFGIPIALWGLATNVVLLYFIAITRFNLVQDQEKTSRYAFLLATFTFLVSVVMGVISTQLGNLCIFCMGAYVLSLIAMVGTGLGASNISRTNLTDDVKDVFVTERWVAGFLIFIPVLTFLANIMYLESQGFADLEKLTKEKVAYWQVSPQETFDHSQGLTLQKGTMEPVMTIVEFADFLCPHCKHAVPSLHAFTKSHPDVKLVFKPFPLDGTCNEDIQGGGDGIRCGLATAVFCSEKIAQKGWETHDYFFENQEEIHRAHNLDKNLEAVSSKTLVNVDELKACVKDPEMIAMIRKMAKEGATAKIRGTPTVYVNGRILSSGQLIPVLEAAYQTLKK